MARRRSSRIFRSAFAAVGLPYFNPHSLRKTLVDLGQKICVTPEEYKAWSQNLGHEHVLTTFTSYGEVAPERQGEIIQTLGNVSARTGGSGVSGQAVADAVAKALADLGVSMPQSNK